MPNSFGRGALPGLACGIALAVASPVHAADDLTIDARLAAGAEYILEVVLNATTQATAFNISDPVSAVPLPGTALLFGTALLGGIGFMRRRGQKGNAAVAA